MSSATHSLPWYPPPSALRDFLHLEHFEFVGPVQIIQIRLRHNDAGLVVDREQSVGVSEVGRPAGYIAQVKMSAAALNIRKMRSVKWSNK